MEQSPSVRGAGRNFVALDRRGLGVFFQRLKTGRQRFAGFVDAGKDEGHREEFYQGGADGRVLADDRFLERVLMPEEKHRPAVALSAIIGCISKAYEVSKEDLRGPARTRVLSEARRTIGWLARHFEAATIQEVAAYFYRDASTFSRHIGKIDAAERKGKGGDTSGEQIHFCTYAGLTPLVKVGTNAE